MNGLIPDANIEGPVVAAIDWLRQSDYGPFWDAAGLDLQTFSRLGWPTALPDREIWTRCQTQGLVLVTDNRNQDGPDSLEATLRDSVRLDSLPVVTIADKERFLRDRGYANQVAVELLQILIDLKDNGVYLGAGRVFLPLSHSR